MRPEYMLNHPAGRLLPGGGPVPLDELDVIHAALSRVRVQLDEMYDAITAGETDPLPLALFEEPEPPVAEGVTVLGRLQRVEADVAYLTGKLRRITSGTVR